MKIVLANNEELVIITINRNYRPNDNENRDTLSITLPDGSNVEDILGKITEENCKTITVVRDGFEDIVYENYELLGISENITNSGTNVNINLIKQ